MGIWEKQVSEVRLRNARDIQKKRQRRSLYCDLIDCLQLSDKVQILFGDPVSLERLGQESKRAANRVIEELEFLQNHLARPWTLLNMTGRRLRA